MSTNMKNHGPTAPVRFLLTSHGGSAVLTIYSSAALLSQAGPLTPLLTVNFVVVCCFCVGLCIAHLSCATEQ